MFLCFYVFIFYIFIFFVITLVITFSQKYLQRFSESEGRPFNSFVGPSYRQIVDLSSIKQKYEQVRGERERGKEEGRTRCEY